MLSKQEWDELQQLSFTYMPEWWYNLEERDAMYEAYVKGHQEWKKKESVKVLWGTPSVDTE
jgi:hypothetical protein